MLIRFDRVFMRDTGACDIPHMSLPQAEQLSVFQMKNRDSENCNKHCIDESGDFLGEIHKLSEKESFENTSLS